VQEFQADLMHHIFALHQELKEKRYAHGGYRHFKIADPKPRDIHKAQVRDRLLHHAIYRILYPFFDARFISDSYSCRLKKGTHKAMDRFRSFANAVSKNHTHSCFVLKCDIRKFFASVDQSILLSILKKSIPDQNILWLLGQVITSFPKGLPLGNLTSQLLVNIYMNEFDQFVKHQLKMKHYIRYADDFVFLSSDKKELENLLPCINQFLQERLKLELHPDKVFITTLASGVDFLGWVHFTDHRILRTATKKRMFRRLKERQGTEQEEATRNSYLGLLLQGNTHTLQEQILLCSMDII
jgi:RNA-directed DNA polymerase